MEEWKEYKLGEIVDSSLGKMLNKNKNKGTYEPYLANVNVRWGNFVLDNLSLMKFDSNEEDRYSLKYGDLVLCEGGEPGRCAIWKNNIPNMKIQKALHRIRCHREINNFFLFYWFLLAGKRGMLSKYFTGTTIQHLPSDKLKSIDIKLSPLPSQQKIARILSSLDDKIELNNKINTNLEQQAHVLFKNWFVDFAPFGGKMPEGWKVGKLSDLITIKYGKDHKKLDDGKYPVYGSGGIMRYVDKFLYNKESVLIPRKGTLNNVFYINEPFWSVDTMFYTEMKKENIAKYVYFFVKGKDLNSMNAGSAVPSMTTEILNAIEVVIPSDEYLEKFDNIVSPMFKQIKQFIYRK